jgi:hypothetical protein
MKNIFIKLIAFFIFFLPLEVQANDFMITLSSSPLPNEFSIDIKLQFDKPTNIYYWSPGKSIYPLLNCGLFIRCHELGSKQDISFMPYEKLLPKFPDEHDVLNVKEYKEVIKIVPGENYLYTSLKKGRYSIKLIYDTEELRKYPAGKKLTPIKIESNEIFFEIN